MCNYLWCFHRMKYENILRDIDTSGWVGSYGGVNSLFQEGRKCDKSLSKKQVKTWLSGHDAYTLHKPLRINFPRNKTMVSDLVHQWQCALIDIYKFSKENSRKSYLNSYPSSNQVCLGHPFISQVRMRGGCCLPEHLQNKTGTSKVADRGG